MNESNYVFYAGIDRKDIKITKPKDALKYSVVAVRDTYEMEKLRRIGFKEEHNLILLTDADDVWHMVQSGRVDITMGSTLLFNEKRKHKFQIVYETPFHLSMYLAANINTDVFLLNKITTALNKSDDTFPGN